MFVTNGSSMGPFMTAAATLTMDTITEVALDWAYKIRALPTKKMTMTAIMRDHCDMNVDHSVPLTNVPVMARAAFATPSGIAQS